MEYEFMLQTFVIFSTLSIMTTDKDVQRCSQVDSFYHIINNVARNGFTPCKQWVLNRSLHTWKFADFQQLFHTFPIDGETGNYVREVKNVLFSAVSPIPLRTKVKLAAVSRDALRTVLDLGEEVAKSDLFLQFVSGNKVLPSSIPLSHRYGGHQFGYWSGQLGDGRAVMLGEYVNTQGERWELQLKGSGLTPYSRQGDGRAVVRSSVREFLCSEAMYALGIPTSRAATLAISRDPVKRDQFYNGNVKTERAAVVLRMARSWFRIGSLEILAKKGESALLKKLVDFVIVNHFPAINSSDPNRYLSFFQEVVEQTAAMVARWQSVGFTHGVCNTDNFSILSITIDYGPFGFMEAYDPRYVPNTSDDESRYSYEKQPDVALFNLDKLRTALLPLLTKGQAKQLLILLKGYVDIYKTKFMEIFPRKLGLVTKGEDDEQFVAILLKMMEDTRSDFTMTFREMSELNLEDVRKYSVNGSFPENIWSLNRLAKHEWFSNWLRMYIQRMAADNLKEYVRQRCMQNSNPRYVLRNWMAQVAIEKAEQDDFTGVEELLEILQNPYIYHKTAEANGYASAPPFWAKRLKVSCSS